MTSSDNPLGAGRRVLLAAGTKTYLHGADFAKPLATLDRVPYALRSIVETLTILGYAVKAVMARDYLLNPSVQRLKKSVRAAARSAPVVVVYYTGHGLKPERSPYYLLTAESKPGQLDETALEARKLLDLVLRRDTDDEPVPDNEQPQVLIILDCCFSGSGGIEALKESLQAIGNPNVWIFASASSVDYAQQGRFAAAFRQALLNPETGPSQQFLGLDWIAEKVKATLGQKAPYFPPGGESSGLPPFFPNPNYMPNLTGLTVAEQHWMTRLRGVPKDGTTRGFYVTGRTGRIRAVEDLARWMREPGSGGLAAVTGSPGCGKSAVLALPVILTEVQRRKILLEGAEQGSLLARAADQFEGLRVLPVHARGMNTDQVARTIAGHLGHTSSSAAEFLENLDEKVDEIPGIIVVNAVDEARVPDVLLTGLLLPLAHRPGVRLVIGARRHALPLPAEISLVVDLDADAYRDPQALAHYANQLLLAPHEADVHTPYRDCDDNVTNTVAAAIAEKATARSAATGQAESFLLAQLLARAVRGRKQVIDVTCADWADQFPADVGAAFDEDLARLGDRESTARALLAALAWARGPGLPWETIWVPVARALVELGGTGTPQIGDNDVRWLLENAGAYVVEDLGPGDRSVFRPFHDLLAAHLRSQPNDRGNSAEPVSGDIQQKPRKVEKALTQALLGTVPTGPADGPHWELAHPYLYMYLAQHAYAADSSTFAALVEDLDYLAIANPVTLSPLLSFAGPTPMSVAKIYRRARPLLGSDVRANAAHLQEAVVSTTGTHPADQRMRPTYRTRLASVRRDDSLLTLTGHMKSVESVAFGASGDGRLLLASGSSDGTVRIWDPMTGAAIGKPLTGRAEWATAVAFCTHSDGRLLLASGSSDGTVRIWDPMTGAAIGKPLTGHVEWATSMAFCTHSDGRLLLATGSADNTVRIRDAITGAAIGKPLTGHTRGVTSVAFGVRNDSRLLVASGSRDGTVRIWDPLTGTQVNTLIGHTNWVASVAFGVHSDGRLLLASGSMDKTMRIWDPITGKQVGEPPSGHTSWVDSVAFGTDSDGRLLLASGSDDGTVRIWDPLTGTQVNTLIGHTNSVASMAFAADPTGKLLLASGSDDNTVRIWNPITGDAVGEPPADHTEWVTSVAFSANLNGSLLLASRSADETVRLWDAVTGAQIGKPLTGHTGSVAFGAARNGRLLLVSSSNDNTVRMWDPITGDAVGKALTGHTEWVTSVAFGVGPTGSMLVASGSDDNTVRVWDLLSGPQVCEPLTGHTSQVTSVTFGADTKGGLLLASGSLDGTVRLWDPATGTQVGKPLIGHTGAVYSMAFGTTWESRLLLATGGDQTVRLWNIASGTQLGEPLTGHTSQVTSVAFGAGRDGRLLASGSEDATVRLWDLATRACVLKLHRRSGVHSIAVTDLVLAIGDEEGICVIELDKPTGLYDRA